MKVKVPMVLVRAWNTFEDWANVALLVHGRLEIRIIDILLLLGFLGTALWYGLISGWQEAIAGMVMYAVFVALSMFVRGEA